ncbi:MAG: hypothetical protein K8T91_19365 [Planctomycetes bacterium]|nr:hypothetical protein [Planctomycetota bacterium]
MRTARDHVRTFRAEGEELGLMEQHGQAMECRDCESFLQLGIDAFRWLNRADEEIRSRIYKGKVQFNQDVDDAIGILYEAWLGPCDVVQQCIKKQVERGFDVENLTEFQACEANVRAIVADNRSLTAPIAALGDQAIKEHRAGQTSEWTT